MPAPRPLQPLGAQARTVDRFTWEAAPGAGEHTLVLLDAGYAEVARHPCGGATEWTPDAEVAARLAGPGTFHWYVLAEGPAGLVKSPIEPFQMP